MIKFSCKTLRLLPDSIMEPLIAHEMAHVYQRAIGKDRLSMTRADLLGIIKPDRFLPFRESGLLEIHADEMVQRWGYDHLRFLAFLIQNFHDPEKHAAEYVPRKKPLKEKIAHNKAGKRRELQSYYDEQKLLREPLG